MPVLERWRYADPLEVAISEEQAATRRKKKGRNARSHFEPCDGCRHQVRNSALDIVVCDMGKKRFIKCGMFDKGDKAA